jgi:hypothetical protein
VRFGIWVGVGYGLEGGEEFFFRFFYWILRGLGFGVFGFGGFDEVGDEAFELIRFFVGADLLGWGEGA